MNGLKGWRIDQDPDARPAFPPHVIVQVKALACELPMIKESPCLDSVRGRLLWKPFKGGSLPKSVVLRSGDGSTKMPLSPGSIEVGYFLGTRNLSKKRGVFWICTKGFGATSLWVPMNTSSRLMKRPVSRQEVVNIRPLLPGRERDNGWNPNTSGVVH